ncbi:MAG: P-loop NTPase fold protein [Gallionella sp.]
MSDTTDNWISDDKLGRKEAADFLTSYLIKRYSLARDREHPDTFVLNIKADWGFGKSFFLQRWSKDLKQLDHPVVFFNAWENDFCDDPLIGFIAEINESLADKFQEIPLAKRHLDQALAVGRKLIKPVGLSIASLITKQLSGLSIEKLHELYASSGEVADDSSEKEDEPSLISQCAELALKEHLDTKETITLFKKKLGRLIEALEKETNVQLPLFIFIDELDRCRPTYAIELLEAVKHLFGVPGVYFVVATNLEQLGHSICAVYGEKFDSERYLKRFFDQEYLLPSPENARFTEFLFSRYSFSELGKFYSVIEKDIYPEPLEQVLFTLLCDSFKLSLRDREQVAVTLQAVLLNWPKDERIHFAYLLFLIIAKQISSKLFLKLADKQHLTGSGFGVALNLKFKIKSARLVSGYSENYTGEFNVIELLSNYYDFSNLTCKELWEKNFNSFKYPDKIGHEISQDCPRNHLSGEKPVPPISDYARRVSQSGQLVVSK